MTDDELAQLLRDQESELVERKASISDGEKIRQAICAFANDLPDRRRPGVLFIGVHDDGTRAQLQITDRLLQNQVTRQSFGQPGVTDYRNPHLAEAMKNLGYVQRFGVGIPIARQELEKNGNPPLRFQVEGSHVLAILEPRS